MRLAPGVRRTAALTLALAGLFVLSLRAFEAPSPYRVSFRVLSRFWAASVDERLLNSPILRNDPAFGRALLTARRSLTPGADALLVLPDDLSEDRVEEKRRAAAYVLAPRRVLVSRERSHGEAFRIVEAPR